MPDVHRSTLFMKAPGDTPRKGTGACSLRRHRSTVATEPAKRLYPSVRNLNEITNFHGNKKVDLRFAAPYNVN
ncbi:hypothetical protein FF011L_16600 [Roseimaritima multifibrata]|uniref:Uncharacterized protein n=1 Tax=Roseimaritima multifibrata TaxID=1930274 RepID=A0A517MDK0_9BACT|nr:hypothetical protein FF011L_16600 [Roseimaritima multifibrata]